MSIDFWTTSNMNEFWGYVRMLLETISPGIMITVAVVAVGLLVGIVVSTWRKAQKDQEQEQDYEVRRY